MFPPCTWVSTSLCRKHTRSSHTPRLESRTYWGDAAGPGGDGHLPGADHAPPPPPPPRSGGHPWGCPPMAGLGGGGEMWAAVLRSARAFLGLAASVAALRRNASWMQSHSTVWTWRMKRWPHHFMALLVLLPQNGLHSANHGDGRGGYIEPSVHFWLMPLETRLTLFKRGGGGGGGGLLYINSCFMLFY